MCDWVDLFHDKDRTSLIMVLVGIHARFRQFGQEFKSQVGSSYISEGCLDAIQILTSCHLLLVPKYVVYFMLLIKKRQGQCLIISLEMPLNIFFLRKIWKNNNNKHTNDTQKVKLLWRVIKKLPTWYGIGSSHKERWQYQDVWISFLKKAFRAMCKWTTSYILPSRRTNTGIMYDAVYFGIKWYLYRQTFYEWDKGI